MVNQGTYLLYKRTFLPLFLTQFFGAFNDNVFKLSMLTLISYYLSTAQTDSEHYQALAGALYTIPFFLFSTTAGQLVDKFDKARVSRWIKVFELLLTVVGGFALYQGNIPLMLTVLTGLGVHSTFFGPIKYAILPDHLPRELLLLATGLIEASTFLAILLGTTIGALAIGSRISHVAYAILITNLLSACGLVASYFIPPAPSKKKDLKVEWNILRATTKLLKEVMGNQLLSPAILAISWFWLLGIVLLIKLPDYVHYVLRANTHVFAVFLSLFSVGIAIGSLAINRFLAGKITLRYVPLTMFLFSVFAFDLYWASPRFIAEIPLLNIKQFFMIFTNLRVSIDFFLISLCGGLFVVPLYTYLQVSSDERVRAQTIAANNIVNAFFMVVGTIVVMVLVHFGVGIAKVFLLLAILNAAVAFTLCFFLL
jgi:MFS family permease